MKKLMNTAKGLLACGVIAGIGFLGYQNNSQNRVLKTVQKDTHQYTRQLETIEARLDESEKDTHQYTRQLVDVESRLVESELNLSDVLITALDIPSDLSETNLENKTQPGVVSKQDGLEDVLNVTHRIICKATYRVEFTNPKTGEASTKEIEFYSAGSGIVVYSNLEERMTLMLTCDHVIDFPEQINIFKLVPFKLVPIKQENNMYYFQYQTSSESEPKRWSTFYDFSKHQFDNTEEGVSGEDNDDSEGGNGEDNAGDGDSDSGDSSGEDDEDSDNSENDSEDGEDDSSQIFKLFFITAQLIKTEPGVYLESIKEGEQVKGFYTFPLQELARTGSDTWEHDDLTLLKFDEKFKLKNNSHQDPLRDYPAWQGPWQTYKNLKQGQDLAIVGYPLGFDRQISFGNVSSIVGEEKENPSNYFFGTAPTNPGNSGGPAFVVTTEYVEENGEFIEIKHFSLVGLTRLGYRFAQNINGYVRPDVIQDFLRREGYSYIYKQNLK